MPGDSCTSLVTTAGTDIGVNFRKILGGAHAASRATFDIPIWPRARGFVSGMGFPYRTLASRWGGGTDTTSPAEGAMRSVVSYRAGSGAEPRPKTSFCAFRAWKTYLIETYLMFLTFLRHMFSNIYNTSCICICLRYTAKTTFFTLRIGGPKPPVPLWALATPIATCMVHSGRALH